MNISNIITNILHLLFVAGAINTRFFARRCGPTTLTMHGRPGKSCMAGIKLKPPLCWNPHIFAITDTFH